MDKNVVVQAMNVKPKKINQWSIDRGYNMNAETEERTFNLLSCIKMIKDGKLSVDEGMRRAQALGAINNANRYRQSTATCLKCYGLLSSTYETTEIADLFVNKRISFKSMLILQLLKKEYKYDDNSEVVRPLFVLFKVLLELRKRGEEYFWIDCYDYFEYLTEVKSMADISAVVLKIIQDRQNGNRIIKYQLNDFDIWTNTLVYTGLLKEIDDGDKSKFETRYTIPIHELDFIQYLLDNEHKLSVIHEYNHKKGSKEQLKSMFESFGKIQNGILGIFPTIEIDEPIEIKNLKVDMRVVIEKYLFDGIAMRKIEEEVFGFENTCSLKGFFAKALINSCGLNADKHKGIYKPFKHHLELLKLSDNTKKCPTVYEILFEEGNDNMKQTSNRVSGGINRIYYGIPGCGKSYKISALLNFDKKYESEAKKIGITEPVCNDNIFRTTFFLDYSNSDFVGQLIPKTDGKNVTYVPNFGPFTKALKRTMETDDMVYLVIEEINRGNAAAIFGDLFQLLDRLDENKAAQRNDGSKPGDSEYPITNTFLEDYLGIEQGKVIIPSNLTILATMNTSDQNVFPLDTAFKRRWDRERVVGDMGACPYKDKYIPYTDIKWKQFVDKINTTIVSNTEDGSMSEDKQIGPYFASYDMFVDLPNFEDEDKLNKFFNNVVDYLFNDVSKFDHKIIFNDKLKSFDDVDKQINSIVKDPNTTNQMKDTIFKNIFNPSIIFNNSKEDEQNEK